MDKVDVIPSRWAKKDTPRQEAVREVSMRNGGVGESRIASTRLRPSGWWLKGWWSSDRRKYFHNPAEQMLERVSRDTGISVEELRTRMEAGETLMIESPEVALIMAPILDEISRNG